MIRTRSSGSSSRNPDVRYLAARPRERNSQWLARTGVRDGILLLGGASLVHFRTRVAQSHLRRDLLPSFWSLAGILREGREVETVVLDWPDASAIPETNAVRTLPLRTFDDPAWYPNVAVLRFSADDEALRSGARRVRGERSIVDLPRLVLAWLGFVWGAGGEGNPLLGGNGHPSAAFVEAVHALADIELTPGLSSEASCPEAIWMSAMWWRRYYQETAGEHEGRLSPSGAYVTRQRAAFVLDPGDPGGAVTRRARKAAQRRPRRTPQRGPRRRAR
jgi:hypothetical protein